MNPFRKTATSTLAAMLFTVLAVAAPCAAWYVVGSREARQRADEILDAPRRQARETASRLAERLRDRLETLRANESKRPFYHYQNLYHDPRGAYEGIAVVPSPLAQGPIDPLIRTYFQLDAGGRFTLPQLNEATLEETGQQRAEVDTLQTIRRQLELQAPTYVAIVGQNAPPVRQVEQLDSTAWAQNVQANEVYFNLRNPGKVTSKGQGDLQKLRAPPTGNVQIGVAPLQWHTVFINKAQSLIALRDVQTPQGRVIQGFLISGEGIADALKASPLPAQFLAGAPATPNDTGIRLDGSLWHVTVDAHIDMAAAQAQALGVQMDFVRVFYAGMVFASVAGCFVVWLVWQNEKLARQRSQFAASAAHELRTPLAGLRLYSDMLAEGLGDPGRLTSYARRVADEAERLGRVVSNMLGFTRLERGTLAVHPEPGDLAAAVRDCVARQQPALEAAGATLESEIAAELPAVKFDRDALAQIVQNLLDNAEKHTRNAPARTIHLMVTGSNGAVELTVRDHGPGVPRKLRRRLFHPFVRGSQADAPAGVGLGLVLVRALARAHGGDVSYNDSPGGGAMFVVTFPA